MTTDLLRRFPKQFCCVLHISLLLAIAGTLNQLEAATKTPVLISNSGSTRAIALESVTLRPEPFALTSSASFSADNRTRIAIFATSLELLAGETANNNFSAFSADAQDSAGVIYPLTVEYVG